MKKLFLAIPLGALLLTGCYTAQDDVVALQKEVIKVQRDVNTLKREQSQIKAKIDNLSKRIDSVSEIASQNARSIEELKAKMRDLERKIRQQPTVKKTRYTPPSSSSPKSGLLKGEFTDLELYEMALKAYKNQRYDEARKLFRKLIEDFPHSKYYDNALFWIGQSYYMEGKYSTALKYFDKLIRDCKNGIATDCNKLPMAKLKKAYTLIRLGRVGEARELLEELMYGKDEEVAELAEKKLESLK